MFELRSVLQFVGGAIGRAAGVGMATGFFLIVFGMSPAELVVYLWQHPPAWFLSGWTRLFVLILGLTMIYASLRYNVWHQQQKAIDSLAEDISWAIHNLLNRQTPNNVPNLDAYVDQWEEDYRKWCDTVHGKLCNRAFFTRADQLHVERLGFVPQVGQMTSSGKLNWLLSQLNLKFDRLREVINLVQLRRR